MNGPFLFPLAMLYFARGDCYDAMDHPPHAAKGRMGNFPLEI